VHVPCARLAQCAREAHVYTRERTCPVERVRGAACARRTPSLFLRLFMPLSTPQGESAPGLQCFWSLWLSLFAVLLFASLSRPRRGQMEPVEGERQTAMLGQPGLPASPTPPADTSMRMHTHTLPSTVCSQIKHPKSNGDTTYT
jgi:hypothetical protein